VYGKEGYCELVGDHTSRVREATALELRSCLCSDHMDNMWTKFTLERVGRLFKNKLGLRIQWPQKTGWENCSLCWIQICLFIDLQNEREFFWGVASLEKRW